MYLYHVKPGLLSQHSSLAKGVGDLFDLFNGHVGDVRGHLLVEQRTQLLRRDLFAENTGDVFDHALYVGVGLVELCTDPAIVLVCDLCQFLIVGKSLFAVKALSKPGGQYRNVANDDHGTSAGCDLLDLLIVFLALQSHRSRCKDNAVFQFQGPQFNRA